jgi:sulfonate transport system permease protein
VAAALWESLRSGEGLSDGAVSLGRVLLGVPLAVAAALPLGLWFGRSASGRALFAPSLEFLRNVPPIALIPLLILWLGIGEAPKIWVVALAALFPVLLNVEDAARRCDPALLEMGRAFGLSAPERLRRILLPWILPSLLVGLRLGFGYGWRALAGAELLGASAGLGYRIREAQTLARSDQVLAGILLLGLLGMLSDAILRRAAARFGGWSRHG